MLLNGSCEWVYSVHVHGFWQRWPLQNPHNDPLFRCTTETCTIMLKWLVTTVASADGEGEGEGALHHDAFRRLIIQRILQLESVGTPRFVPWRGS